MPSETNMRCELYISSLQADTGCLEAVAARAYKRTSMVVETTQQFNTICNLVTMRYINIEIAKIP